MELTFAIIMVVLSSSAVAAVDLTSYVLPSVCFLSQALIICAFCSCSNHVNRRVKQTGATHFRE